ncbi:MAG: glycosyltransferase [Candidatus Omnitrophica bacterium]|nr:glycosyltransferase [Candidatus Omnitrophota bacterium]
MTNLLMVQRFDVTNVGCAERIWRQAEELVARGYRVTLVEFPHAERRENLPLLRPSAPAGVRVLPLDHPGTAIWKNTRILAQEIESADLVHLWKCYPDTGIPVLWGLRGQPRPLHYDWDDLEGGEGGIASRLTGSRLTGRLMSTWESELPLWADSVSVASSEIARICRSYGVPETSIYHCPVGATSKPLEEEVLREWRERFQGKRVLTFLGQMEAEDFPPEILLGISKVLNEKRDLLLAMVGDGGGRVSLQKKAKDLGLANRCLFTGYLPHFEAQAILALSTGFLFPLKDDLMSRCKSPLVVVESLARGTPVIGSQVGEVPGMVGDCGVMVSGLGEEDWRRGLTAFLERIESEPELPEKCRQRFLDRWTWKQSVVNLEKAYQHALNRFESRRM